LWGKRAPSVTRPAVDSRRCAAGIDRRKSAPRDLQPACPPRFSFGTTRVRARRRAAQNTARSARDGIRRVASRFAKYLVGYTKTRAKRFSAGPNDASTRQKLAFPS
jgi:hypothetical protein